MMKLRLLEMSTLTLRQDGHYCTESSMCTDVRQASSRSTDGPSKLPIITLYPGIGNRLHDLSRAYANLIVADVTLLL